MEESKVIEEWLEMLSYMLNDYREKNPYDPRSDKEILDSLMEYFADAGLVGKKDGKFVVGKLIDDA